VFHYDASVVDGVRATFLRLEKPSAAPRSDLEVDLDVCGAIFLAITRADSHALKGHPTRWRMKIVQGVVG